MDSYVMLRVSITPGAFKEQRNSLYKSI